MSMDDKYDNIFIEWLWHSVKYEDLYLQDHATVPFLDAGLHHYFPFYNTQNAPSKPEQSNPRQGAFQFVMCGFLTLFFPFCGLDIGEGYTPTLLDERGERKFTSMKRNDAFRKLHTVCTRLDAVNPEDFFVVPLRLYLYGSLLTNKPNPSDVDLLFQYSERKDLDPMKMLNDLLARKPLPHDKASTYLRKGMQKIRIELLSSEHTLVNWRQLHAFETETPIQLIWEPGLNWCSILQEIEDHPSEWQPAVEAYNKARQAKLKQIKAEQGEVVAETWFRQAGEHVEEDAPGSKDKEALED